MTRDLACYLPIGYNVFGFSPHIAHDARDGRTHMAHITYKVVRWREAGFECETPIKNSGAGAAMMRVEAARRIFPRCTNWQIQIAVAPAHAVTNRTMVAAPSPIERAKPVSTCLR